MGFVFGVIFLFCFCFEVLCYWVFDFVVFLRDFCFLRFVIEFFLRGLLRFGFVFCY